MLREHLKKRRGEGRRSGEQQYPIFCFAQEKRSGINAEERERGSLLPASPSPGPMLLFAKLHNPLVPKQGWIVSTILRATGSRKREREMIWRGRLCCSTLALESKDVLSWSAKHGVHATATLRVLQNPLV